jgi:hypothetical protein
MFCTVRQMINMFVNVIMVFFLSRKARNFFPEFNTRLYDKYSESDYFFFPPPKSEYFFQQLWESEYLKFHRKVPENVLICFAIFVYNFQNDHHCHGNLELYKGKILKL